jgi:hypothetical protein
MRQGSTRAVQKIPLLPLFGHADPGCWVSAQTAPVVLSNPWLPLVSSSELHTWHHLNSDDDFSTESALASPLLVVGWNTPKPLTRSPLEPRGGG